MFSTKMQPHTIFVTLTQHTKMSCFTFSTKIPDGGTVSVPVSCLKKDSFTNGMKTYCFAPSNQNALIFFFYVILYMPLYLCLYFA